MTQRNQEQREEHGTDRRRDFRGDRVRSEMIRA
jgi:hypothetical protein